MGGTPNESGFTGPTPSKLELVGFTVEERGIEIKELVGHLLKLCYPREETPKNIELNYRECQDCHGARQARQGDRQSLVCDWCGERFCEWCLFRHFWLCGDPIISSDRVLKISAPAVRYLESIYYMDNRPTANINVLETEHYEWLMRLVEARGGGSIELTDYQERVAGGRGRE